MPHSGKKIEKQETKKSEVYTQSRSFSMEKKCFLLRCPYLHSLRIGSQPSETKTPLYLQIYTICRIFARKTKVLWTKHESVRN